MVSISLVLKTIAATTALVLGQQPAIAGFDPSAKTPAVSGPLPSSTSQGMSKEDYAFLQSPQTQQLLSLLGGGANITSAAVAAMFGDSRLDVWTTLMTKLVQGKVDKWAQPQANSAITIPKEQKELTKTTLLNTNIQIPVDDEDWPDDAALEVKAATFIRDYAPFIDDFKQTWKAGENKEGYVMSKVGKMWPKVHVFWNDRYSDKALNLLVFNGVGSHLVEKLPQRQRDGSYYAVTLNFMDQLEVRPGFAKYGADAYFNSYGEIVKIVRQNRTYYPNDKLWEYIKMAFRGSLMTKITAIDHLLGLHMTVGNYLTTVSREQLPPDHPLRRLIKPFTFRAVAINRAAARSLFWTKAYMHRALALTDAGLTQTWKTGTDSFKFETFPETVARQNIDTVNLPFHNDGMSYWNIVRKFVGDYVNLYYRSDDDVVKDTSVEAFWAAFNSKMPMQLRPLTMKNLKDTLAQAIFWVTAMHNHMGNVAEYVSDPAFMPGAWVEGELAARPGAAVRQAVIMALTGLQQPSILDDFSHVMLDNKAKKVCKDFNNGLTALGFVNDFQNAFRDQAFTTFNPQLMDISVGI
ncbi:Aste57867_12701 [Aphanomyces stellatus]|uniref:Aste57867_12701 protein n=1 Tax=Aphanomyces stellatus TaxID=120398 RepID=A0A485KW94_9STRA|nr:hypothetical protein As57867_012653 [Aphanomyces stellatus]VFT89551.1 Aste57867_12701 [Aphanomyces stellatus]